MTGVYCVPAIWESNLRDSADHYNAMCKELFTAINDNDRDLYAWFHIDGEYYTGAAARSYLSKWITASFNEKKIDRYGFLVASAKTLDIVDKYNKAGKEYAGLYAALRRHLVDVQGTDSEASYIARQVLSSIGEHATDLERVRRQAGIITTRLQRIRWFVSLEKKTSKRMLSDAITRLEEVRDTKPDEVKELYTSEIKRLTSGHYDPHMYVAEIRQARVRTYRYRVWAWDSSKTEVDIRTFSGTLPLFCAHADETTRVTLPKKSRKSSRGREVIISENNVSELLPNWLWYEKQEKRNNTKAIVGEKTTIKNSHILQTGLANIKIVFKKEKSHYKPYLSYSHEKTRLLTSLNVDDYLGCWKKHITKTIAAGVRVDSSSWVDQIPSEKRVISWIAEFENLLGR
jgi:hypothetical protein